MLMAMFTQVWRVLRDQRGIETVEWLAVLALLTAIGFATYGAGAPLAAGIGGVVAAITGALGGLAP
jgi:hypothetical protein